MLFVIATLHADPTDRDALIAAARSRIATAKVGAP